MIKTKKCGCPEVQTEEDTHVFGNIHIGVAHSISELCEKHRLEVTRKDDEEE